VPHGIDATATFFSPAIPGTVKMAVPLMHAMPFSDFEALAEVALAVEKRGSASSEEFEAFVSSRGAKVRA